MHNSISALNALIGPTGAIMALSAMDASQKSCPGGKGCSIGRLDREPQETVVDRVTRVATPRRRPTLRLRDTLSFINTATSELAQSKLQPVSKFGKS